MIPFLFDYASPSNYEAERERALLGMSADLGRPVRFRGVVKQDVFLLRVAMRALGEAVWSDDTWYGEGGILDPVITVHPDRLFFEAFSQDQSVYAALIVDPHIFETEGEVVHGTTNVDFSAWLWGALGEMRSSRKTTFEVGPEGFAVKTTGAGGRFERKVELPDEWVRGFLQLQGAMAMPGTRLRLRAIDLLSAIRYMRFTKAKVSPRALRFELAPGQDARLVLEPWEHAVPLRGAEHNYEDDKTIRVWGRRRLKLIEGLLPFAEHVDVYLKGRALPSFYAVRLPNMTFLLGLSGWTARGWTGTGGFDLLAKAAAVDDPLLDQALQLVRERVHLGLGAVAEALGVDQPRASSLMVRLSRRGQVIFDVERREYRHRELFREPPDEAKLFPPDPRRENATRHLVGGRVSITSCTSDETRKTRRLKTPDGPMHREVVYRDWRVRGAVADQPDVEVVVGDSGRIIFGTCGCAFFRDNILNLGPCEHILALFEGSEMQRKDLPTSVATDAAAKAPSRTQIQYGEVDGLEPADDAEEEYDDDD